MTITLDGSEIMYGTNSGIREFTPGKGTGVARDAIRRHVKHLDVDRALYPDHNAMKALVKSGEILEEVEKTVGKLE